MNYSEWLIPFLSATPWMVWFFLGVGIPCALALLPRRDWRDWTIVIGTGLALGPLFGTTWLFILGTVASFTFEAALIGTFIIAGIGGLVAYRRRDEDIADTDTELPDDDPQMSGIKWALLVMMTISFLAVVWDTAFWPFLRYDTLWTFGYNAKIFMLYEEIPTWIDYYPNLVPLTFTFGNLAWGEHHDHAARAAVPFFILASTFAAYLAGWRIFQSRFTGLLTAGFWLLLPSSMAWASSGDLEHVMPIYFTLATVFFILAWREPTYERRYAILSGLMLAGAMWTKPTSGSFVLGVGIVFLAVVWIAYRRQDWDFFRHRFQLMLTVGLASAPIGGMWYLRNILAGHRWTNLPPAYWQDLAQRSGMQLVWLYTIAIVIGIYLLIWTWQRRNKNMWQQFGLIISSLTLLSIAILPTLLTIPEGGWTNDTVWAWFYGLREPERRLFISEFVMIVFGTAMLVWAGRERWKELPSTIRQGTLLAVAIGAPFFAVYFWSFSYHYRLALTVMPLILSILAAILVGWLAPIISKYRHRQAAVMVIIVVMGLYAPVAASYHTMLNSVDREGVRTSFQKYRYANPALMQTVQWLELFSENTNQPHLDVLATGENRLAFFFPSWDVDDETLPTDVSDLEGYDLYLPVFSNFLWRTENLLPNQVQAWVTIAETYPLGGPQEPDGPNDTYLDKVLLPISPPLDDGNNRYVIFTVNADAGYADITPENPLDEVIFSDVIQLEGYDLSAEQLTRGEEFSLSLYWRGADGAPPTADYTIYVHFLNPETNELVFQMDGGMVNGLFPTRLLTQGLLIQDVKTKVVPADLQPQEVILKVGIYLPGQPPLQVTQDGELLGDGVILEELFFVE